MTGLWMFLGTLLVGLAWLAIFPLIGPKIDRATLRAGLWMNGVDGRNADEIIEHHMRK